jgi:uncharacterized membrane protein
MSPLQKDAIYCLIISSVSVAIFFILMLFKNMQVAFSAFAIFGLYGLTPLIFYRKSKNKILVDERDKEIANKAGRFGFGLFWVAFVIVAVLISQIKADSLIPASLLSYIVFFGMIAICAARAIIILVLYRQGKS